MHKSVDNYVIFSDSAASVILTRGLIDLATLSVILNHGPNKTC